MDRIALFVGLDYHKDSIQVCVLNKKGIVLANKKSRNDRKELVQLVNRYGIVKGAAIEACTGAAALADELIQQENWPIDLAHAGYVARIKQSPDKSDYSDAQLLADLVRVGYLPKVWLAPESLRELRRLVRYRTQRMQCRKTIKLRVSSLLREHRVTDAPKGRWGKRWCQWILSLRLGSETDWIIQEQIKNHDLVSQEIERIESRMIEIGKKDPLIQRLLSYKGLQWISAWTIRAEIGNFHRFSKGKQLARFCGLSPRNASSGERQADSGLVRAGNKDLRIALIELAHRLVRYDGPWKERAERMTKKGKPKNVIIATVANRWVRKLYYEMIHLEA
ncbi:MAG: IS110 family transposase [bacterium]|jgi:transposase|nr:IS110 family transposase [bacterium]